MRIGHVDYYLRLISIASLCLLGLVTIRPRSDTNPGSNSNNFLLFEANINNNNNEGQVKTKFDASLLPRHSIKPRSSDDLILATSTQTLNLQSSPAVNVADGGSSVNETEVMEILTRSMRILCICQTTGPRHKDRAVHVKATWGKRCSKLIFASDEENEELPAYRFSNWAGREYVSFKMRGALQWAYDNYINEFEWFLKADDDAFIIVENLRLFLSNYNPEQDHYFGRHFSVAKSVIGESFVSGAAYALSRKALKRLIEEAFPNAAMCPQPTPEAHEDVNLGYCLAKIGIFPGDTRDHLGRQRFLVFSPWVHLMAGSADNNNWIRKYDKYEYVEGEGCCSDTAIMIHYVPGSYMLAMEYFLYRLRPIGSGRLSESVRSLLPSSYSNGGGIESFKEALISNGYKLSMTNAPRHQPFIRTNNNNNNKRRILAKKHDSTDQTTMPPM